MSYSPFADPEIILEKIKRLKKELPDNIKLTFESPRWSFIQAILAQGDRKLSIVLKKSRDLNSFHDWQRSIKECKIDVTPYMKGRKPGQISPWNHIKDYEEGE